VVKLDESGYISNDNPALVKKRMDGIKGENDG
jgi:hypothetical protein